MLVTAGAVQVKPRHRPGQQREHKDFYRALHCRGSLATELTRKVAYRYRTMQSKPKIEGSSQIQSAKEHFGDSR